jgi:tetratricopeptide (TPR) repeat protein
MNRLVLMILTLWATIAGAQTLEDAKRLTLNEQHEAASSAFRQLVAKFPVKGDYWFYFGENLYKSENPDSAKVLYTLGVQNEPTNPLNFIGLGKVALSEGNQAEADQLLKKGLDLGAGKNVEALIRLAEVYITAEKKNLPEAFKLLQSAEKLQPKNPEIQILNGDAFLENNDGTSAIKYYEKAKALDPKSPAATLRIGQLWLRARNYQGKDGQKGALEYYQEAIQLSPDFAPAYRELGDLYALAQRYPEAKENYTKYLELSKGNTTAKRRYAAFLFLTKDYEGTLNQVNELLKVDTTYNILNRLAAYAAFEAKKFDVGLAAIEKFLARQPENKITANDFTYYGKILSALGKDSLAVVKLETALSKDSSNTDLFSDLAVIYSKQKRYEDAIRMYQKKVSAGKAITNDYFRMGQAYYQLQQFGKADTAFEQITIQQPKLITGYVWRAKANSSLDADLSKGQAKPFYEKVVEIGEADEASANKYKKDLGEAYRYLYSYYNFTAKDKAQAQVWLEKLVNVYPEDQQLKKALEEMKAGK